LYRGIVNLREPVPGASLSDFGQEFRAHIRV